MPLAFTQEDCLVNLIIEDDIFPDKTIFFTLNGFDAKIFITLK